MAGTTTTDPRPSSATPRQDKSPPQPALRMLVAMDGSEGTGRALNHVLRLQQRCGTVEVVVLKAYGG